MKDCRYSLEIMKQEVTSKLICPEIKYAFESSIEVLEKQIPKKPKIMNTTLVGEKFWWYCGHCDASRHTGSKSNYCGYCGGKVDWD